MHLLSKKEKRFGQSLKPNDEQNIYKFPVGSLTLKKCTVCLVWLLCPLGSPSPVRDGSLAPRSLQNHTQTQLLVWHMDNESLKSCFRLWSFVHWQIKVDGQIYQRLSTFVQKSLGCLIINVPSATCPSCVQLCERCETHIERLSHLLAKVNTPHHPTVRAE